MDKKEYIEWVEQRLLNNLKLKSDERDNPIYAETIPKGWKCIGTGNYAAVFTYEKKKDWVVKVYGRGFEGLEKEADVYRKLGNHTAYSQLIHQGENYLVLKRLEGITLYNAVIKGVRIPKTVIEDVEEALQYARKRGLNPYDIHGKNVMMNGERGYVVDISDFYKEGYDSKWDDLVKAYYKIYRRTLYIYPIKIPYWVMDMVRKGYRKYKKLKR